MFEQKTFLVSQSNKYAKNSGVYLDLHPVLQCFKVVSSWIRDYQHVANREWREKECNHHEDNDHFEEEVKKDSENFYGSMKEFENQFIEFEEGIMFIETRQVLLTETNNSVTDA